MALLDIVTFPNPALKTRSKEIETFDAALETLVSDMFETMYDAPGVGLAANQVGVLQRVAVIDVEYSIEGDEEDEDSKLRVYVNQKPRVIINPVIVKKNGEILFKEGCLSVPGFSEDVKRCDSLELNYQDLQGKTHSLDATGLLAVCIQHEIDHLDGKLFIDRLSIAKRGLIKSKIKKERGSKFERSKFHVEL